MFLIIKFVIVPTCSYLLKNLKMFRSLLILRILKIVNSRMSLWAVYKYP